MRSGSLTLGGTQHCAQIQTFITGSLSLSWDKDLNGAKIKKNIQNAVKTLSDKELKELALRLLESKEVITIDHEEEEDDDNDND